MVFVFSSPDGKSRCTRIPLWAYRGPGLNYKALSFDPLNIEAHREILAKVKLFLESDARFSSNTYISSIALIVALRVFVRKDDSRSLDDKIAEEISLYHQECKAREKSR